MRKLIQAINSNPKISLVLGLFVLFAMSLRLFFLIKTYAVNMMFSDEWEIFGPMFSHAGIWQIFNQQYGPHRQGMGGLIIWMVSSLSHWNTNADAYATFILVFAASIAALFIKRKAFGKWALSDLIIPVIFLTVSQFEVFIITPNEAHSAFPLLGVLLFGLSWLIPNRIIRYVSIVITNFVTMFTGFGVFIGIVAPFLLALDGYEEIKNKNQEGIFISAGAVICSLFTVVLFFRNYVFAPAVECFKIVPSFIPKYPAFMSVILSRFLGVDYSHSAWFSVLIGFFLLVSLIVVFIFNASRLILKQNRSQLNKIILAFSGFTLLFLFNAAVGRLCLGLSSAYSSRYVTLSIPGLFAIYLYLLSLKNIVWRNWLVAGYFLFVSISLPLRKEDIGTLLYFTNGKNQWKECYLQIENIEACNEKSKFWVYPPIPSTYQAGIDALNAKFKYLKKYNLNFYADNQ